MGPTRRRIPAIPYLEPTAFAFFGVVLAGFGFGRLAAFGNLLVFVGGVPLGYLARYLLLGTIAGLLGVALLLHGLALVVRRELEGGSHSRPLASVQREQNE